jgi:hypothetical protein
MSYERMAQRAAKLEAEVGKWFAVTATNDAEQGKLYGADKTGAEIPDWEANKIGRPTRSER